MACNNDYQIGFHLGEEEKYKKQLKKILNYINTKIERLYIRE